MLNLKNSQGSVKQQLISPHEQIPCYCIDNTPALV